MRSPPRPSDSMSGDSGHRAPHASGDDRVRALPSDSAPGDRASVSRRATLGFLGATALARLTSAPAAFAATSAVPTVLTAADVHVADYPTVEAIRWMGEVLERETSGRLGMRVYHSGQLGRESDAINLARFGALDIARVNVAALNNPFPLTDILALPYVFDSTAHMRRALDGAPGRAILRGFEARGLIGLAFYDSGTRCFYNHKHPIVEPASLKGLKVRVPPSDIFVGLIRALGANPTPLSYGEVFSALQTRLIDGAENNWTTFFTSRQFEVAQYWSQSEHSYAPEVLLMSKRKFDALASADRELILATAARSVSYMRERWDRSEGESRAAVEKAGTKVAEVNREAFRDAAAPLLDQYLRDSTLEQLYRDIRALA